MSSSEEAQPRPVSVHSPECQILLHKAIDGVLDDLIIAGADKVIMLKKNRRGDRLALSRSQVRNVVNESLNKSSREALTNFIRYQMGRQGGDPWRFAPPGRLAFGREIIRDIEGEAGSPGAIDLAAGKVAEAVKEQLHRLNLSVSETDLEREARSRIIQLYLGYLNRTYAYCEALDKEDKECWNDIEKVAKRKGGQS